VSAFDGVRAELVAALRRWGEPDLASRAASATDLPALRAVLDAWVAVVAAVDGDAPMRPQSLRAEVFIYDERVRAVVAALRSP